MPETPPKIALIGRTNVGKSTLFNRLVEKNAALVSSIPGTTRDRKEADCLWRGKVIRMIDTGGLDGDQTDQIERDTARQAEYAMKEAAVILFVVDLKTGALPQEKELAKKLRQSKKPVIVVGNKAESLTQRVAIEEKQWQFGGLPKPFPVSALRGTGVGDLLDEIYNILEKQNTSAVDATQISATRVAVIGKPNVGKSSLLNALLKEERFIASPIAHTTREPIDTLFEVDGKSYVFIDTAGMRKKAKAKKGLRIEAAGVKRTKDILKKTDVALFVLEADKPLSTQDLILVGLLQDAGVGVIFVANKWDLVEEKEISTMDDYKKYIEGSFPFLTWAPILFVSAKSWRRVDRLFALIDEVQKARSFEIPKKKLKKFLRKTINHHKPKAGKGTKPPSIIGLRQIGTAPPKFVLLIRAKRTDALHASYPRYIENSLHKFFPFNGTPVIVRVRTPQSRGE